MTKSYIFSAELKNNTDKKLKIGFTFPSKKKKCPKCGSENIVHFRYICYRCKNCENIFSFISKVKNIYEEKK